MISVRNISKRFGKQVVLDGVSIEIEEGKTTTIVGPSGVGKSVLLKLITGIMHPEAGEVFVGGRSITACRSEAERNEVRANLGVLFQSAALFDSLTVFENIAFPLLERVGSVAHEASSREEIQQKVIEMMRSLSLERYSLRYPEEVSIGVRKRVGLARALVTEPQIMLFDEPNTGLDPYVGQEVYDLIQRCRKEWGFTAVVISHELPEVFQVSDKVVMLLGGNVVFEGTPEEMQCSVEPAVSQFLHGRIDGPIKIQ
jgi:phospholipid/cholesterol/gamma-HCH transport system ATP-binding protein